MSEKEKPLLGIECRGCGCRHFFVRFTRPRNGKIMRRKECRHCGKQITTFEVEKENLS